MDRFARTTRLPRALPRLALAVVLSAAGAGAQAGAFDAERIHEDSFGNLIVQSPSGSKLIVVGKGFLAEDLGGARSHAIRRHDGHLAGGGVIARDESGYRYQSRTFRPRAWREARHWAKPDCRRGAVLLHGRSYMYGLPDNTVPVLTGSCL